MSCGWLAETLQCVEDQGCGRSRLNFAFLLCTRSSFRARWAMADATPQVLTQAPSPLSAQSLDTLFYRPADAFFREHSHTALT